MRHHRSLKPRREGVKVRSHTGMATTGRGAGPQTTGRGAPLRVSLARGRQRPGGTTTSGWGHWHGHPVESPGRLWRVEWRGGRKRSSPRRPKGWPRSDTRRPDWPHPHMERTGPGPGGPGPEPIRVTLGDPHSTPPQPPLGPTRMRQEEMRGKGAGRAGRAWPAGPLAATCGHNSSAAGH